MTGRTPTVAVIGAGFGGLGLAVRLKQAGFHSFRIFEKSGSLGGTWLDNTFPGSACDIAAHLYSYSFARYRGTTRRYPDQRETLDYLRRVADDHELWPHLEPNTEITELRYEEDACRWRLRTAEGDEHVADIVVSAVGQLSRPRLPDLPGLADFGGASFHSARWDHGVDLTGKDVVVIGNGSSAVQIIPAIAPQVRKLYAFQRSPTWVLARPPADFGAGFRAAFKYAPPLQNLYRAMLSWRSENLLLPALHQGWTAPFIQRMAVSHLERQVPDPELRERLRPDYPIGCKRIILSSDYFPALSRDNVEVVTEKIVGVRPDGLETADGTVRKADVIVHATGFHSTQFLEPLEVVGRSGRRLRDAWSDGARAYLGMAVPDFPNLFLMYGPNTNLGHNSIVLVLEQQADYIVRCLRVLAERGGGALDARPEALESWVRLVEDAMADTVWTAGCTNWFKDGTGKIVNNWPLRTSRYRRLTRSPRLADYAVLSPSRSDA